MTTIGPMRPTMVSSQNAPRSSGDLTAQYGVFPGTVRPIHDHSINYADPWDSPWGLTVECSHKTATS
jgi:hypothetical protein